MAGRNHVPRHLGNFRGVYDDPRAVLHRQPVVIEEELELQQRDLQRLLAENRHVIDDNVMLQRDLTVVKDEIHRLSQVIAKLNAERDIHQRELIERGMKLEAELRSTEPLRVEVVQLRTNAQRLTSARKELSSQVQNLKRDANQLQSESKQITVIKADIEKMKMELTEARRIHEYEKKGNEELVEQNRSMEKNLVSMAREIEILRAELASADRRAIGVGVYGVPDTRYPGRPYGDTYGAGSWGSYDKHGPPRH